MVWSYISGSTFVISLCLSSSIWAFSSLPFARHFGLQVFPHLSVHTFFLFVFNYNNNNNNSNSIDNKCIEYLEITLSFQNLIQIHFWERMSLFSTGSFVFPTATKRVKFKINKLIVSPRTLNGYEPWSVIMKGRALAETVPEQGAEGNTWITVNLRHNLLWRYTEGAEVQLYSFFNLGARWGGWLTLRIGQFNSGKKTRFLLYRTLGRPQGRSGRVRKISSPPGFDPRTVQLVVSGYTDWGNPAYRVGSQKGEV